MGNLFSSIISTAGSLRAFQQGIGVVQNNVANASTAGYAKQVQDFEALPFDLGQGLAGGVSARELIDYRDQFAERAVRINQSSAGDADARAGILAQIEPAFSISGDSGLPGAFATLFRSFSQLSVTPNNSASRQVVLDSAVAAADAFNQTAAQISNTSNQAVRDIETTVAAVNGLLERLRDLTRQRRSSQGSSDPSIEAEYYSTLEELAEHVDFNAIEDPNGVVTILIGGQTPALIGDRLYPLRTDVGGTGVAILDAQGADITRNLTGGRLTGQLTARNVTLPAYLAALDSLTISFADRVNQLLSEGVDASGNPPARNLFSYDATAGAAATIRAEDLDPSELAAALAPAPGGNGNAIRLAQLASARGADGFTFAEQYGNLASRAGRDLQAARADLGTRSSLLLQAQALRAESSQVSLDEEAVRLIEYQKSYEAAAKLVNVLTEMTDTLLGIL